MGKLPALTFRSPLKLLGSCIRQLNTANSNLTSLCWTLGELGLATLYLDLKIQNLELQTKYLRFLVLNVNVSTLTSLLPRHNLR